MKLYINGSPRLENSNSNYFLNRIKDNEKIKFIYRDKFSDILKNITEVDTIILCFPLYVDGPPCKVIEFMEYINDNNIDISNKKIYTIINSGFWEAKHNRTASLIVENFANSNEAKYMGTFNIGAGEIVGKCDKVKLYKLVSIPFLFKIRKFKNSINDGSKIKLETTIRPMSKRLYAFMANINWKRQMVRNGCYK